MQSILAKKVSFTYLYIQLFRFTNGCFGKWSLKHRIQCNALLKSVHQTMAFKDQSTIPKATFIEIGVLHSRSDSLLLNVAHNKLVVQRVPKNEGWTRVALHSLCPYPFHFPALNEGQCHFYVTSMSFHPLTLML